MQTHLHHSGALRDSRSQARVERGGVERREKVKVRIGGGGGEG